MIPAGYEGSNHFRKNLHYPLSLSMEPTENKWILHCLSLMLLTKKCIEIIAKKGFPINVRCEITDTIYVQTA